MWYALYDDRHCRNSSCAALLHARTHHAEGLLRAIPSLVYVLPNPPSLWIIMTRRRMMPRLWRTDYEYVLGFTIAIFRDQWDFSRS